MTGTSSGSSSPARSTTEDARARKPVLLDANALLLPVRARFPLRAEVERLLPGARLVVPSSVVEEVDRLVARGVPGARAAAALARSFLVVPAEGRGDQAILDLAVRRRAYVVTADRALAARLSAAGLVVLVPRDRHRLQVRPGRSSVLSRSPVLPLRKGVPRRQRL
ncbi:MAG TPA: twitching motility protein PilT [Thermoplasmata archaeon]|nr:twitching motility protein PilT [Thermoplasmata archaeon]